jgi:integrase
VKKARIKRVKIAGGLVRWRVDLRKLGGGRRFCETKTEADAVATIAETEAEEHGRAAFELSVAERAEFVRAKEKLGANGTIEEAVDYFLKFNRKESVPLKKAIDLCIAEKKATGKRHRYVQQLSYALDSLKKAVGNVQCSEVSAERLRKWLDGQGWAPATRRGRLIDVGTFFSFARARGWCAHDPVAGVGKVTLDNAPPAILTVEQCRALLAAALELYPSMIPYFALGLFCGIRPQEIFRLTWPEVDLERGFVEVTAAKSKTRQRRLVTISDNCKAWLRLGGDIPPVNWQKRFDRVAAKAKITPWPQDGMRHSFCSYHLAMHQSPDKTAHEMGHRSTQMLYQHYRELVRPDQAKEFWGILPP